MKPFSLRHFLAACMAAAFLFATSGLSAQTTYTRQDNTSLLNTAGAWNPSAVPTNLDTVVWNGITTNVNTFLGGTVTWGEIQIGSSQTTPVVIGSGSATNITLTDVGGVGIDMSNAGASLTIAANIGEVNGMTFNVGTGQTLTLAGIITGSTSTTHSLTKSGAGTLQLGAFVTLTNASITASSTTVTVASTVGLAPGMTIASNAGGTPGGTISSITDATHFVMSVAANATATITTTATSSTAYLLNGTGLSFNGGTLAFGGGTYAMNITLGAASGTFDSTLNNNTFSGALAIGTNTLNLNLGSKRMDYIATGNGGNITGNGTIAFGTSTGTLRFNNNSTNNSLGGNSTTFDLGTSSASLASRNAGVTIYLGGLAGGSSTFVAGGSSNGSGPVKFSIGNNNSSTTFSGQIRDANTGGGFITNVLKIGTGTFTLDGFSPYTGNTVINGGTVAVANLDVGGVNSSIGASTSAASNLVLNGATLKYTGAGNTTDRLFTIGTGSATLDASGTGAVTFSNTSALAFATPGSTQQFTLTLSGSNAGVNSFAPVIGDQSGSNVTNIVKAGAGQWELTGVSTFTGSTNINGGTLRLTGNLNNTSSLFINNTGKLSGLGQVLTGPVTLNNGGILSPGVGAGNGVLTLPSLTWAAGGNLAITALDGVNSDHVGLGVGALTKSGSGAYNVDFGGMAFTTPFSYTLISFGSESGFVAGDFTPVNYTLGPGLAGNINLATSGPGSLTFDVTAVPEPAVYGAALGAVALVLAARRRRTPTV